MLTSQFLLATLKEIPADAELVSHQLMLRAGLIRKLASGLYTWLPLGMRVLQKVETIVREEMEKAGALEMLMPAIQPAELWHESGRWEDYGNELLKMQDRHERQFCFGPTHEEVITQLMRNELNSYKQLPLNIFQIQVKFRDEIRPRFGVMRAREFLMKDAYSFHTNNESLEATYQKMFTAYTAIFTRLGLKFRSVLADSGQIGGAVSQEFQVIAQSGEDVIVYSDGSDYAANLERAESLAPDQKRVTSKNKMEKFATPGLKTITALQEKMNIPAEKGVKTLIVNGADNDLVALILRGDHTLSAIKAGKLKEIAKPFTLADEAVIKKTLGCGVGSLGPVNLKIKTIVDRDAAVLVDFVCGANEDDFHFKNVNWGRDCDATVVADLREVVEGDLSPDGKGRLQFARGIEVGHIFQLGDKYSRSMQLTVLDENGKAIFPKMGCYGIGISRIVAAAIEQNHDDKGIIWPQPIAPFQIVIVPVQMHKSHRVHDKAFELYNALKTAGFSVLMDDRKERPGVMFATMDLIGIPHRIIVSERGIDAGTVEIKARTSDSSEDVAFDQVVKKLATSIN